MAYKIAINATMLYIIHLGRSDRLNLSHLDAAYLCCFYRTTMDTPSPLPESPSQTLHLCAPVAYLPVFGIDFIIIV